MTKEKKQTTPRLPQKVITEIQKKYPSMSRNAISQEISRPTDIEFQKAAKKIIDKYNTEQQELKTINSQLKEQIHNGTTITTAVPSSGG